MSEKFLIMIANIDYKYPFVYKDIEKCSSYNKERNPLDVLVKIYNEIPIEYRYKYNANIINIIDTFYYLAPEIYCNGWLVFFDQLKKITKVRDEDFNNRFVGMEDWVSKVWYIYAEKVK